MCFRLFLHILFDSAVFYSVHLNFSLIIQYFNYIKLFVAVLHSIHELLTANHVNLCLILSSGKFNSFILVRLSGKFNAINWKTSPVTCIGISKYTRTWKRSMTAATSYEISSCLWSRSEITRSTTLPTAMTNKWLLTAMQSSRKEKRNTNDRLFVIDWLPLVIDRLWQSIANQLHAFYS